MPQSNSLRDIESPQLVHVVDLKVEVAKPIEISETRRIVSITGGEVTGPKFTGTILSGTDFQSVRADGVAELQARYVLQLSTGELIYVENNAMRHGPVEAMERLRRGEPVDPKLIYFRGIVRFETAAPDLQWLARHFFIAMGARFPTHVELSIFQLL